jgi:hypothetical protein
VDVATKEEICGRFSNFIDAAASGDDDAAEGQRVCLLRMGIVVSVLKDRHKVELKAGSAMRHVHAICKCGWQEAFAIPVDYERLQKAVSDHATGF